MSSKGSGMNKVDLRRVSTVLNEVRGIVRELDGTSLDERRAVDGHGPGNKDRARASQTLNLLADRLELAAALTRVEYWNARGYEDPTGRAPIRPMPTSIDGVKISGDGDGSR